MVGLFCEAGALPPKATEGGHLIVPGAFGLNTALVSCAPDLEPQGITYKRNILGRAKPGSLRSPSICDCPRPAPMKIRSIDLSDSPLNAEHTRLGLPPIEDTISHPDNHPALRIAMWAALAILASLLSVLAWRLFF